MLTLRPATLDDFDATWRLVLRCILADFGEPLYGPERLLQQWHDLGPDLATHTCLACVDDVPVAYGLLRVYAADDVGVVVQVPPDAPDGVETAILDHLEAHAKASGASPIAIGSQVNERNRRLKQAFEQRGYTTNLAFLTMEIVLTAPPNPPSVPTGIDLRPFVQGRDEQATYAADEAANQDKSYYNPLTFEAWLQRMNLTSADFDPALWWLAWDGAQVAGVSLCYYAKATDIGWIDHLGVGRAWRRRGLGMALMLQSYAAFWEQGITRVRLNVESDSPTRAHRLYERAGMTVIQSYHIYKHTLI